jgi:hypothetical protein
MADNKDYRDPKVTKDSSSGGGMGKWIVIAIVALLALLALLWLLGLLGDDEVVGPGADPEAIVVTPDAQEEIIEE